MVLYDEVNSKKYGNSNNIIYSNKRFGVLVSLQTIEGLIFITYNELVYEKYG